MAAHPCCTTEDVEAGVQVLRVDRPVYPRRAEHNTVAEGGNRRWPRLGVRKRSNRAGQGRPEDPRRRHRRKLTSPPLPSSEARRLGLNGLAHPIRRLVSRLQPSRAEMRALRASGPPAGLPSRSGASSWRPLRPSKSFDLRARSACAGGGGGRRSTPCLRKALVGGLAITPPSGGPRVSLFLAGCLWRGHREACWRPFCPCTPKRASLGVFEGRCPG
jgi:hypothetical protein